MSEEEKSCYQCKYFYDLHEGMGEFCTHCSQGVCYMCMEYGKTCPFFEKGDVPDGKIRGQDL